MLYLIEQQIHFLVRKEICSMKHPKLNLAQIWNMSFGFLGIQFGFALQNANASRILQTYGSDVEHLSWFWLAAPITGMIIQPIIGYYSDRTWCRLGRRKPYFLAGAILTSIALIFMPNSGSLSTLIPPMFIGAGMLMIMDASINVAMEPFRALVADLLPSEQRTLGFSIQTFLIGVGAVVASWFPYILAEWFGISKTAAPGEIPDNVIFSFYVGAAVLLSTVLWTIFHTKEYPPEIQRQFTDDRKESVPTEKGNFGDILRDIVHMPRTMAQLGIVQFFSWFALFSMWVYTTPAVAERFYGTTDASSEAYQIAGNWVGVLFGIYNAVAMVFALFLPVIAKWTNRKTTHALSLFCGGLGLISFHIFNDPYLLIISMVGIGIAWASILAMPYAILAGAIPATKMGVYMGIFNFFITIPQIVNGVFNGFIVEYIYHKDAIYALSTAGIFLMLAAISVIFVKDKH